MSIKNSILWVLWLLLVGCVSPSEQQANKEKLLEGLKDHQVIRVTQEQIMTAALTEGQQILAKIDSVSNDSDSWKTVSGRQLLDSLSSVLGHGNIKMVTASSAPADLGPEESAIWDAYLYSAEQNETITENVQRTGDGQFILYTSPITQDADLKGMWSVLVSKKTLIRNMEE